MGGFAYLIPSAKNRKKTESFVKSIYMLISVVNVFVLLNRDTIEFKRSVGHVCRGGERLAMQPSLLLLDTHASGQKSGGKWPF